MTFNHFDADFQGTLGYTVFCWPFFPIRDLWMWGITPVEKVAIMLMCSQKFKYTILIIIILIRLRLGT